MPKDKERILQRYDISHKKEPLPFMYVANDVWYSSAENMRFAKQAIQSDLVMPIKCAIITAPRRYTES